MQYEVELKFPLTDESRVVDITQRHQLQFSPAIEQVDQYYAHPARDFGQTDEAFRSRRIGNANLVTYKGPRVDKETKTRKELELPLPDGSQMFDRFDELWKELGFRPVGTVRKLRREATFDREGRSWTITHDEVDQLGHFIELETLCSESDLPEAQAAAKRVAAQLQLGESESRSYLELQLAR